MNNFEDVDIDNSLLFKYINQNGNDLLSNMSGVELQELLYYLELYRLCYRKTLKINKNITFGLELEFGNLSYDNVKNILERNNLMNWSLGVESKQNLEIDSPILTDTEDVWLELKKVCDLISANAKITDYSAGHIHIGAHIFKKYKIREKMINFLKLYEAYENIIFRFLYSEYLCARPCITEYAACCLKKAGDCRKVIISEKEKGINEILYENLGDKFNAVTFRYAKDFENKAPYNTIEFRSPNGTLNPIIWQNNVNFLVKLIEYSKNNNFNDDVVSRRINLNKNIKFELYNEIFLEQALELSDMIYSNNLEKMYFLKQYLKSFEVGNEPMIKAKEFTRYRQ